MSFSRFTCITRRTVRLARFSALMMALPLWPLGTASAADDPEDWSLHGQMTFVDQYHPAFKSPYSGANSLDFW